MATHFRPPSFQKPSVGLGVMGGPCFQFASPNFFLSSRGWHILPFLDSDSPTITSSPLRLRRTHVFSWYPSRSRPTFQGPIRTVKFMISFAPARVSSRSVGGIELGYAASAEMHYPIPSQFTTSPASPATRRRYELYKFALGSRGPKPLPIHPL
jgi:hypothetical protein